MPDARHWSDEIDPVEEANRESELMERQHGRIEEEDDLVSLFADACQPD
jgi:hypothetical protein